MSKKDQQNFLKNFRQVNFLDKFFNNLLEKKDREQGERGRVKRSLFSRQNSLRELQRKANEISPFSESGDEKGAGIKKHKVIKRKQSKKKAAKKKKSKKKQGKKKKSKKKQGKKKKSKNK